MKVVAFVPVKLNNERLPGKNTLSFDNGQPLISYILETLNKITNIDEKYVYCSDDKIRSYIPPGITFLRRDPYLDLPTTNFNEILTTFAEVIDAEIYILTHATAPFISKKSIEKAIKMVASGNYDCALSVVKLQEFLWKENKPFNYDINAIPRTQDLPLMYTETCGLYVYTKDLISNKKSRVGDKPFLVEVSKLEAIDINDADDFQIANVIFNARFKKKED